MTDQAEKIAEKIYELAAKRIVGETDIVWSKESIASLIRSHTAPGDLIGAVKRLLNNSYIMIGGGVSCNESDVEEVRSALSEQKPKVCEWVDDDPFWIISCQKVGLSHSFHEPVIVRKWKACPYCTNPIEVKESDVRQGGKG